jgi:hypothetical protein
METFLGMEVEQSDDNIYLHLDKYIKDIVEEYSKFSAKTVRLKNIPSQQGVLLTRVSNQTQLSRGFIGP